MKKLTKKQQTILDNIRESLDTSTRVIKKYKKEDNFTMVTHMQGSIQSNLEGIVTYLIYSDMKSFNAIEGFIDEIKDRPELQLEYAMECGSNIREVA